MGEFLLQLFRSEDMNPRSHCKFLLLAAQLMEEAAITYKGSSSKYNISPLMKRVVFWSLLFFLRLQISSAIAAIFEQSVSYVTNLPLFS